MQPGVTPPTACRPRPTGAQPLQPQPPYSPRGHRPPPGCRRVVWQGSRLWLWPHLATSGSGACAAWRASAAMVPAAAMGGPVDRAAAEGLQQGPPDATLAPCYHTPGLDAVAMDSNSLSQSLDSVNTAISVVGEEEVSGRPRPEGLADRTRHPWPSGQDPGSLA